MIEFKCVVMDADFWSEFDFLDLNLFLMFFCFVSFFMLFIQKFTIIHYPANRRIRLGGYLNKIQASFLRQVDRVGDGHDSQLLFLFIDNPDFSDSNPFVNPVWFALICTPGIICAFSDD